VNGVLATSTTPATAPWVRIPSTGTVTPAGGSANSYVDGYIRRQGATAFTMPTGNGGKWRRIAFSAPSIATEFEARYVAAPNCNNETVRLKWTTASELNNDYFTLERSGNGIDFNGLGRITGAGNNNNYQDYYFEDISPLRGINYYRLSQTDFDGRHEQLSTI